MLCAIWSHIEQQRIPLHWYDIDSTLRTAITLLQNCPEATRAEIAKEMAKNVIEIIKKEDDDDEEELEEE